MRCKKLKRDGERKRERERGEGGRRRTTTGRHGNSAAAGKRNSWYRAPWLSFLFAKLVGVAYVSYVSYVSQPRLLVHVCVAVRVYGGSINDRPVYRHVVGRKSFGDRGPRKWTERTRDLLSRVEGFEFAVNRKASASTTHKTPSVAHTRTVFRRPPAALSATSLNKFQHALEFAVVRFSPTSAFLEFFLHPCY